MGAVQQKCCAVQEVQGSTAEAVAETKCLSDQPIPPQGKPLWLTEAEAYVALQKQKEAEAALRLKELAEKAAEEERQAKAEAERKAAEEEAKKAKEAEAKAKKKTSSKKAAAPKTPTKPDLEEDLKAAEAKQEEPAADKEPTKEPAPKPEAPKAKPEDMRYEFEVKCVSARGLRDADWLEGTSDPYCLCESVGKVKSKFKTKTVKNKENPVWNQAAKMQLGMGDTLKFSVYDQDMGKADDFLGYIDLPFEKIYPQGFEGELALKDASDSAKRQEAYIKVRIRHLRAIQGDGK
mmetsp:Transcript_21579/g.50187  ORF Transcript_21579/g.50187 Transcript_21579/m.50187 type:complete len:292 (-) Transcript_21579:125-1000(-)